MNIRIVGLLGLMAALVATPAVAQLSCGQVVPKGARIKLEQNVGPCSEPIVVNGPATIDLNGYDVFCEFDSEHAAFHLLGKRVKLRNGEILACAGGVLLADEGRHTVDDIRVVNPTVGFTLASEKNKIKNSFTIFAELGYRIIDAGNVLIGNEAVLGNVGFKIEYKATRARLVRNRAVENDSFGIQVVRTILPDPPRHRFIRNEGVNNGLTDLYDDNFLCGMSRWRNNIGERNQSCID